MIPELNDKILANSDRINEWLNERRADVPLPIYTSVDMRSAGYKIAPIDTNIYPAGFNNLCTAYNKECVISFKKYIEKNHGQVSNILIIAEAHTRNNFYVENLRSLANMLARDGYDVRVGLVSPDVHREITSLEGIDGSIDAHRVLREGDTLKIAGFVPDLVLSNNDFTEGVPDCLKGARQPIDPSPTLGWHMRRKNDHFFILEYLFEEFCDIVGIDPWLIYPTTDSIRGVDFHKKKGLERIAESVDRMVSHLRVKFSEYGVDEEPFVFVKSNSGTYGMAVMSASSGEQFLSLTSNERKKMRRGKGGIEIGEVIVQEGIPTRDIHNDCPVEPVIYLIGGETVGGFYRINCERTIRENLNSRGMTFRKICFHQLDREEHRFLADAACSEDVTMRVFGTVASICAVATGYEYKMLIEEIVEGASQD